jgi:hypothetical protein
MEQQLLIFSLLFEKKKTNALPKRSQLMREQPNVLNVIFPLMKFNAELHLVNLVSAVILSMLRC